MPIRIIPTFLILATFMLAACGTKEIERLHAENDSLRNELESRHSMVSVMNDIKLLIDSIDANRQLLRTDLNEGTTYDDVTTRLSEINSFVKKTTDKITKIEKELKSSKKESHAYLMMMDALKGELQIRVEEVDALQASVSQYKEENKGLLQTVKMQETTMTDMQTRIEAKQQELRLLQAKVEELVESFKVSEAEAYYARAKSVEEAARRTRMAPHKKRETYREALELYKKALSLGKKEATRNIRDLEKRVR